MAVLVDSGDSFTPNGKPYDFANNTITLGADIDLGSHYWVPIGIWNDFFKGDFSRADAA